MRSWTEPLTPAASCRRAPTPTAARHFAHGRTWGCDEFATGFGFSSEKSRWYFDQYLPRDADRRDPRVSPLFASDVAGLPPTLIATAEADPLRDDGERYAERLAAAGVDVDLRRYAGMIHGFFQMTGALAGARRLHADLAGWMRARSG